MRKLSDADIICHQAALLFIKILIRHKEEKR